MSLNTSLHYLVRSSPVARIIALALVTACPACSEVLGFEDVEFGGGDAQAAADGAGGDSAPSDGASSDGASPDASAGDVSAKDTGGPDPADSAPDQAVPPPDSAAPGCGDGECNGGETCSDCPADCGACQPQCGDGTCNGAETCSDCPADCGACPPVCGNASCEAGETCSTCAADCAVKTCPTTPSGFKTGYGLAPIDVCAFPMTDKDTWADRDAVIQKLAAKLPVRSMTDVLGDLNRQGTTVSSVPGLSSVHRGMKWEQGDVDVTYWVPQGLTGSGDSVAGKIGGKDVLVVSWYYDDTAPNKGVRVAIVDAASKAYRFALLVEPYMNGTTPDFKAIPIHAGGLAWFGNLLYVADTSHGFRVFDMSRILEVTTGVDSIGYDAGVYRAHNYKYVIAQIGTYEQISSCSPRFSFTALDRATNPPTIVSGEYIDADPAGRLYRWALDPATGKLAGGATFVPTEAFYSGQANIQGAVPAYGRWLLSSSAPAGGAGALYRVAVGFSSTHAWSDSPEDLSIDPSTGELWGLSEAAGSRFVYSRMVSGYQ